VKALLARDVYPDVDFFSVLNAEGEVLHAFLAEELTQWHFENSVARGDPSQPPAVSEESILDELHQNLAAMKLLNNDSQTFRVAGSETLLLSVEDPRGFVMFACFRLDPVSIGLVDVDELAAKLSATFSRILDPDKSGWNRE